MTTSHRTNIVAFVLTLTMGLMGASLAAAEEIHPLPSIITDIEHHIAELTINIEKISDRMKSLREAPASKDPLIQEVRNLDLKGWELHQEQWKLQLDQLRMTEELLRKVHDYPEEKSGALQTWVKQINEFKKAMSEYRQQRAGIEELRIETEAKLIEQYLR
jgi:chromosome segregation ATPase